MPGFKVSNGSAYVDTKGVSVSDGQAYVAAKGVYVSQGNGTWTPVWPLTSTVSLASPAFAMSTTSGSNTPAGLTNTIASPTFTITLGTPGAVSNVSLQLSYAGGTWTEYRSWSSGITATLTHQIAFSTVGAWQARAVITHSGGTQTISNVTSITCTAHSIGITGAAAPAVGTQTSVAAGMSPSAPVGFPNTPEGWYYNRLGAGWTPAGTANPYYWTPTDDAWHDWVWVETFPDGSRIHSNVVRQSPYYTQVTAPASGNAATVQTALDQGFDRGLPVVFPSGASYNGGGASVRIPQGARVTATGAYFASMQFFNAAPPGAPGPGNDRNRGAAGDGGYNRAGDIIWNGGSFDAYKTISTAFSISHCPSFELHNATIWNTTPTGHGIEINSSGGASYGGGIGSMNDADFKIKIVGCVFNGMDDMPRDTGYDEAIHFDYSWSQQSTGGIMATAAGVVSPTTNPGGDGTAVHNVLIRNCTFQRARTWPYSTSIGNHKFSMSPSEGEAVPTSTHSHLKVEGCNFDWVGPHGTSTVDTSIATATMAERGTVFLIAFREVWVRANTFNTNCRGVSCAAYANLPQQMGQIYVESNTFIAGSHMRMPDGTNISKNYPWVDSNGGANAGRIAGFFVRYNKFTGWVGGNQATWLIRCDQVDTMWVNENYFYGLTGNASYTGQTGNRIHGSEAAPSGTVTGFQCRNNLWSPNADGSGAVVSNS